MPSGSISAEKLSEALQRPDNVISTGTVAAMLHCAESYFNYAYTADGADSGIIYESHKGLYSESLGTNAPANRYSIVCSSFADAVLNGICFENSRYTGRRKNAKHRWGVEFDDTGEFGTTYDGQTAEDKDLLVENKYLSSQNLARYAAEHGYLYAVNDSANIRAGDVLFSGNESDRYLGIGHVAVVVNVDRYYCTLIEAWPAQKTDLNGTTHDVGLRINYRALLSDYTYGATFPVGDADGLSEAVETQFDLSGTTAESATVLCEFKHRAEQGFYTVVCHGSLADVPYISVKYDGATNNTWLSNMHQSGNDYYLTVYVQKPGVISLRMAKDYGYAIDEVTLYRGYADITAQRPHPNRLESGDDLDNCIEGEWYCQNKTTAEAIAHAPLSEATGGFYLDARRMTNGERFIQTVWYAASPGKMYVRMYIASGWMDWLVFSGKAVSES